MKNRIFLLAAHAALFTSHHTAMVLYAIWRAFQ